MPAAARTITVTATPSNPDDKPDNSPNETASASSEELATAARAHLAAWLGVAPLFGLFAAFGIYSRSQQESPWVAQQALQSVLFQTVAFNVMLLLTGTAVAIGFAAWSGSESGDDLVIAAILTALPFYALGYLAQALIATRAARAIRGGVQFRHPVIGRLVGASAPTSGEVAAQREAAQSDTEPSDPED